MTASQLCLGCWAKKQPRQEVESPRQSDLLEQSIETAGHTPSRLGAFIKMDSCWTRWLLREQTCGLQSGVEGVVSFTTGLERMRLR